ncbi:hypothetical protein NPIL_315221 [Nephila pilipes]|uniref:SOCS box domain-containing protein n=1 Tax=Nephila pilipes TaxID=299642 RepID=A0A8X6MSU5_NEPPI|nr:hypothetical protein NPIL_315221 [Nephila pilipes]
MRLAEVTDLWPNASLIQCSNNVVSKIFHEKFLYSICVLLKNGLHFDYSEDVFIDYCKQLDRSDYCPGPRSLQHLCRCSLRQRKALHLPDNPQLPEGTKNLDLPKVLKEYIDLET